MIRPQDIQNPQRPSGFDHVTKRGDGAPSPFVANVYGGSKDSAGRMWQGPRRKSAFLAAQDYCDYVNADETRLKVALRRAMRKPGSGRDPFDDDEVQKALGVLRDARAQRRGRQGRVYLISDGSAVKIGYSVKPEARVNELQTGNPRTLRLLASFAGTEDDEKRLHLKYAAENIILEWFRPSAQLLSDFGLEEGVTS